MPKNYRSPLCVGGPMDGRRVDGPAGKTAFEVAIRPPPAVMMLDGTPPPAPVATRVEYRVESIHFIGGTVQFWAPALQPMNDTIAMLLKSYEQAAIASRLNPTPKGLTT